MDKNILLFTTYLFFYFMTIRGVDFNIVHRSQPIMNNLSPDWPEENIVLSALCYGDINRTLQLSIYDYDKHGKHLLMGGTEVTVASLVQTFKSGNSQLNIQKKKKPTGKINLHWAEIVNN